MNAGLQREGRQVRDKYRLTAERGQTGQGVNTGLQREDRQVRSEYRQTERGQTGQG